MKLGFDIVSGFEICLCFKVLAWSLQYFYPLLATKHFYTICLPKFILDCFFINAIYRLNTTKYERTKKHKYNNNKGDKRSGGQGTPQAELKLYLSQELPKIFNSFRV